jgi:hypothetical protein
MSRPPDGDTPMTGAERQARYRATHANGKPVIRIRRCTVDRRTRIQRWYGTIAGLTDLQEEYAAWLDALPANQRDSAMAEGLRAIVDLDPSELRRLNRRAALAVIEQRDGPAGMGHDDAWQGSRFQPATD